MRIAELMTRQVVSVAPSTSLKEVAAILVRHRISGVPVVDADGRVIGVVSEADIMRRETGRPPGRRLLARLRSQGGEAPAAPTAGTAMTSPPVTIGPGQHAAEAARLIGDRRVNRLPVVDEAGRLHGIVTRADLVRVFARPDEEIARELRDEVVVGTLRLDPAAIEIEVRDGDVRLAGEVDTRADAALLERYAASVPGVVSVRSRLR
jgi:CBS domain-containing protein